MKRTTTPTHIFTCNLDPSTFTALTITYAQHLEECGCTEERTSDIILIKNLEDCVIENNSIKLTLSQEETNLFIEEEKVAVQLHAIVGNKEKSYQSNIIVFPCRKVLNDEVISYE